MKLVWVLTLFPMNSGAMEERELARQNREKAESLDSKGYTRFATAIREFAEQYEQQAEREATCGPYEG